MNLVKNEDAILGSLRERLVAQGRSLLADIDAALGVGLHSLRSDVVGARCFSERPVLDGHVEHAALAAHERADRVPTEQEQEFSAEHKTHVLEEDARHYEVQQLQALGLRAWASSLWLAIALQVRG